MIGARCLVVPLLGGSAVIAFVLHQWWTVLRQTPGARARVAGFLCAALALVHLVWAPVLRLALPGVLRNALNVHLAESMQTIDLGDAPVDTQRVIILAAPDIAIGLHAHYYRRLNRMPMPSRWRVLSLAPCTHRFRRTDDRTLEMTVSGGALAVPHLHAGDAVQLTDLRATVLDAGANGVRRVAFRFDRSLDDPALRLLVWKDGRLRRVPPPTDGETLELPWIPLPPSL